MLLNNVKFKITYKDIGRAESAILQNPVNAGKESETTP
jgi:hypothetical protein